MDGLIYAYHPARSAAQAQYTNQRLAALAEQRKLRKASQDPTSDHIERTNTGLSTTSSNGRSTRGDSSLDGPLGLLSPISTKSMSTAAAARTQLSLGSNASDPDDDQIPTGPFELRHGRRYLREVPYPIPCDLAEMQRQNMRTMLGCAVFGRATCPPRNLKTVPRKVLEIGCGSGYWSVKCHEYFTSLGYKDVSFTGLDIAPLAPDLKKQGINWKFVQHDIRKSPLPFEDGEFDFVMLKDLSLLLPTSQLGSKLHNEAIRILRIGGTLEIWESDLILKSLLPQVPPPATSRQAQEEQDQANDSGTFIILPRTQFASAQNRWLQQANRWIQSALERRGLTPTPASAIKQSLQQDCLADVGMRRVAIPLGRLLWERDPPPRDSAEFVDSPLSSKGKMRMPDRTLSPDQIALRHMALLTVVHMIESLEPMLKEVNGKNSEEWNHWWSALMGDMLDPSKGVATGECLEMCSWWATKSANV